MPDARKTLFGLIMPLGPQSPEQPRNAADLVQTEVSALGRLAGAMALCRRCVDHPRGVPLPHDPRPIFRVSRSARLVIASQAPGLRAHASGVPFNDPSGERLRAWMGIGPEIFYDPQRVAIVPMGFCFPGYDANKGDLPPRAECAETWHDQVFARMPQVKLILTIGIHAMRYHMKRQGRSMAAPSSMGGLVARWADFDTGQVPRLFPLPHPSWRNSGWLNRNPWFEADVLPALRAEVRRLT